MRMELAEGIIELMEKDGLNWTKGWDPWMFSPINGISGGIYRGINRAGLAYKTMKRGFSDPRWCTFKQAQGMDWHVRKGEKSSIVEYWQPFPCIFEDGGIRWLKKTEVGKYDPDEISWKLCLAGTFNVFNFDQIEGPEPFDAPLPRDTEAYAEIIEGLKRSSACPVRENLSGEAFYMPKSDFISLPPLAAFQSAGSYVATLAHEMAHSTAHGSRLARKRESYALEELVAELASVFIQSDLGLNEISGHIDEANHAAYLKSWLVHCKDEPAAMADAIVQAQLAADFVMERYRKAVAEKAA